MKQNILKISRQDQNGGLTPWFDAKLDELIADGYFPSEEKLQSISIKIIEDLTNYRLEAGINTVVLGMSGGVDSALTSSLFLKAGWEVIGVTMPIHQDPVETERGVNAIKAIGFNHVHIDLSDLYDATIATKQQIDSSILHDDKAARIRRGNIRARLRMVTLYNLAAMHGGLVASTDNFSELAAGFWTLNGDVGDLSPIQSLTKSWEVPMLAMMNGVPEETYMAKPTDGLGVDDGDEAQFGFTYLELDIMLKTIMEGMEDFDITDVNVFKGALGLSDERSQEVFDKLQSRLKSTWFKRFGAININHPHDRGRYDALHSIDVRFHHPEVLK